MPHACFNRNSAPSPIPRGILSLGVDTGPLRLALRCGTAYTFVGRFRSRAARDVRGRRKTFTVKGALLANETPVIGSGVDPESPGYQRNHRQMVDLLAALKTQEEEIRQGGGAKTIASQHKKGRLTARERIAKLIDPNTDFFELALYAAHDMYTEWGGAPAAGTVTGLARVCGRTVMVIANDATVKAGAFFPMTAKKVIRAQNIAIENRIPTIYLVDSAGVFLPLQEDVFPDTDDFGRVFRNNAVMSAMGIPQTTAIMGMCVAGGAYLPVMIDHILMTEGSGLFLAGPALVQAAIGQKTSAEELGGAKMHAQTSGTIDFREPTDDACLARIRSLTDLIGHRPGAPFDRKPAEPPAYPAEEIYGVFSSDPARQYDMRDMIARVVDASRFDEYRAEYGQTLICGYARIGGFAVGIVANQKKHVQISAPGTNERRIEFGGVIYTESADKAARFILDCNQNLIPLIFLHDVNGFMVGKEAEWQRDHSRRREDGQRGRQQRSAENRGHMRRQLRRRPLRHVRQGLRSALPVCLAHRALRGDERRRCGQYLGGNQAEAARTRRSEDYRHGEKGTLRFHSRRPTTARPILAMPPPGCGWMRSSIPRIRATL